MINDNNQNINDARVYIDGQLVGTATSVEFKPVSIHQIAEVLAKLPKPDNRNIYLSPARYSQLVKSMASKEPDKAAFAGIGLVTVYCDTEVTDDQYFFATAEDWQLYLSVKNNPWFKGMDLERIVNYLKTQKDYRPGQIPDNPADLNTTFAPGII